MDTNLSNYLKKEQDKLNELLSAYLSKLSMPPLLNHSTKYSIEAGGKRLRPILMKLTCEGLNGDSEKVYPAAMALEMIHTYSLIHDDLPAMDNDTYRRGMLTNHKKFDEATAILAGDGLLTNSFHVISNAACYSDTEKVFLISKLASASGLEGMVAGQLMDMQAEKESISVEQLEEIHQLKTGRLLTFSIVTGAYLAGADSMILQKMERFGNLIGLIFQIQDDILDVIGDSEIMGKASGSDEDNQKSTYPSLLGLNGAIEHKNRYVKQAKNLLEEMELNGTLLEKLVDYLGSRNQ
ncbi:farnesyl-diphosphate synthase [Gracilibacillus ureilyticus]|uniref:Farnesyl diphosphate synthase n=1 Tax=Gracilibacillus ureilyticus TaxID=531814 RepID=A0A1H9LXE1_9BACI|nr:farnesyl diphosphate synthase [Gracilibacillus ureilyticus]SER15865.1 farnesyl-diphosphate synthase [Gracilibacillus ureilyticus]